MIRFNAAGTTILMRLFDSMTRNNGAFASPTVLYCQYREKLDLSHLISHMGNEIRTVRFHHKMYRRRVSFCNQCDIHRSHQALHCSLTDWVFGDLGMRFLPLRSSKC